MKFFVTGISTEVGKTVVSAIIVEALQADYWKPIQAGDLQHSDSDKIQEFISNNKTKIHKTNLSHFGQLSGHLYGELIEIIRLKGFLERMGAIMP